MAKLHQPSQNEPDSRISDYPFVLSVAILLLGVLYGVLVFARTYGESYIDTLDEQVGTVVSGRAEVLARAGFRDDAILAYQQALSAHFNDPEQRVYATHKFAQLLFDASRHAEAIAALEDAVRLDNSNDQSHSLLCTAYAEAGQSSELKAASRDWFAIAHAQNDANGMRWAKYHEGRALRDLGDKAGALEAYRQSFEIKPSVDAAYQASMLALSLGHDAEAREFAAHVLELGLPGSIVYQRATQMLTPE